MSWCTLLPTSPGHKLESLLFGEQVFSRKWQSAQLPGDPAQDHSRLTEHVAKAFCLALCPHLKLLKEDGMTKLGLRVTLDSDQVRILASKAGLGQCLFSDTEFLPATQESASLCTLGLRMQSLLSSVGNTAGCAAWSSL